MSQSALHIRPMQFDDILNAAQVIVQSNQLRRGIIMPPEQVSRAQGGYAHMLEKHGNDPDTSVLLAFDTNSQDLLGLIAYQTNPGQTLSIEQFYTLPSPHKTGQALLGKMLQSAGDVSHVIARNVATQSRPIYSRFGFEGTLEQKDMGLPADRIAAWKACAKNERPAYMEPAP